MARILSNSEEAPSTRLRALAAMAASGSAWPSLRSLSTLAASGQLRTGRRPAGPSRFTPTHGTTVSKLGEAASRSIAGRFSICHTKAPLEGAASRGAPLKEVDLISHPGGIVTAKRASRTVDESWKLNLNWLPND